MIEKSIVRGNKVLTDSVPGRPVSPCLHRKHRNLHLACPYPCRVFDVVGSMRKPLRDSDRERNLQETLSLFRGNSSEHRARWTRKLTLSLSLSLYLFPFFSLFFLFFFFVDCTQPCFAGRRPVNPSARSLVQPKIINGLRNRAAVINPLSIFSQPLARIHSPPTLLLLLRRYTHGGVYELNGADWKLMPRWRTR